MNHASQKQVEIWNVKKPERLGSSVKYHLNQGIKILKILGTRLNFF